MFVKSPKLGIPELPMAQLDHYMPYQTQPCVYRASLFIMEFWDSEGVFKGPTWGKWHLDQERPYKLDSLKEFKNKLLCYQLPDLAGPTRPSRGSVRLIN